LKASANVTDGDLCLRQNGAGLCNLYSLITSQAEIREAFGVEEDRGGNPPRYAPHARRLSSAPDSASLTRLPLRRLALSENRTRQGVL
jgi:hypothetical protein